MARFKVQLEYDGTAYDGWQMQKHGRTVQGDILDACKKVFNTEKVEVYGAGRTDAGVHALCQTAHIEVESSMSPITLHQKLNDVLPNSINILHLNRTSDKFHARFDATMRSYIYQISKRRTAFGKKYCWWVKDELFVDLMRQALPLFEGFLDFQSFADIDKNDEHKSTMVEMKYLDIYEVDDMIVIRLVGSHFLWKMVRRIVGVLVEVGRRKLSLKDVQHFFATASREPAKLTAPPSGLFLEYVYYDNEVVKRELKRYCKM